MLGGFAARAWNCCALLALLWWGGAPAQAEQLQLKNGDTYGGLLERITKDQVIWVSRYFGRLAIAKADVLQLTDLRPLKLRGFKAACHSPSLQGEVAWVWCRGKRRRFSLFTLQDVVPYDQWPSAIEQRRGQVSVSGSEKQGGIGVNHWAVDVESENRRGDWRHAWRLSHVSEQLETVDAAGSRLRLPRLETYFARYEHNWFFQPRWYGLLEGSGETDDFRALQEAYRLGLGPGFQWWELSQSACKIAVVWVYAQERYQNSGALPAPLQDDFQAIRLGIDYRWSPSDKVRLTHRHFTLKTFSDRHDWQWQAETELSVPLGFGISGQLHWDYRYLHQPRFGAPRQDGVYRLGLIYHW